MKIYFSPEYRGHVYIDWSAHHDMLWETAEGVVLIDFKTYSGTTQQLLDPTNPHYAGRYKGQLDCYQRAIEASGQRILDQLIFYPILGDVVRLLPLD